MKPSAITISKIDFEYAKEKGMLLRRINNYRYFLVLNEKIFADLMSDHFSILNKVRKHLPNLKLQLIPFENKPENAKEILNNMGKDIDIVVGIYDEILLGSRNCTVTNLFYEPLRCAVSINHRLADKEILSYEDLYEDNVMIIHKGWNNAMDKLRSEIIHKHPKINIKDFNFFDLGIFNQCENSNDILVLADNFIGVHPLLKIIPVEWDFSTPFGVIHSTNPSEIVKEFLNKIKEELSIIEK